MSTHRTVFTVLAMTMAGLTAQTQFTVVPTTYDTLEAPGQLWLPGASKPLRQQEIIGASMLQGLIGKTLSALEFRRNTQNQAFQGGSLNLTVTLSISPNGPLSTSSTFADNLGPTPLVVFNGQLQIPASPAITSTPGWTSSNILRIPFQTQTPFVYTGGTLCVDMVGSPVAGQVAGWWPADAAQDLATGTVVDLGGGCGAYGGPLYRWSTVEARTLLPGGLGRFYAFGPLGSWGILAFGTEFLAGWPLVMALPSAPANCTMFLDLPIALMLVPFEANGPGSARADHLVPIPNTPTITGASLTAQWVEWTQMASSNAITWTVGGVPGINMAHVDGFATDPTGELFVDLAHVMRFEHN